ncbi:MAG: hypothetical protein V4582_13580 [Pseudomonadota bacterium]
MKMALAARCALSGRAVAALGLAALCAAAAPARAGCVAPGGAASAQPAWIATPGAGAGRSFYGVGVAAFSDAASLGAAREAAQAKASADLAQTIQSEVSSVTTTLESKLSEAGRDVIKTTFDSVARIASELSLRSLKVSDQWIDGAACQFWVRVQLSEADALLARKSAMSKTFAQRIAEQLKLAASGELAPARRELALLEIEQLLPLVDAAIAGNFSAAAVAFELRALRGQVGTLLARQREYEQILARHADAYSALAGAASNTQRRYHAMRALQALQQALALAPRGFPGAAAPFPFEARIAALYPEAGAPCLGALWFAEQGKTPAAPAGTPRSCGAPELAQERRALYLAGRPLFMTCKLNVDGRAGEWGKACALLNAQFGNDGAALGGGAADDAVRIEISASGAVRQQSGADGAGARYRFEGKVHATLRGPEQLNLVDDYEGITGWNNVSAAMTTDLLALAATKKLDAALNAYWEKR